jgi:hypothetical protein
MKCTRLNCENEAAWYPVLLLYAGFEYGPHPPGELVCPTMATCSACKLKVIVSDFIGDDAWAEICRVLAKAKKAAPSRPRTRLVWRPLSDPNPWSTHDPKPGRPVVDRGRGEARGQNPQP